MTGSHDSRRKRSGLATLHLLIAGFSGVYALGVTPQRPFGEEGGPL